ncbi:type II toxin-antitoxin system death-on-curing family toxin [Candidatus Microgenomates bacterium]|nr:type II toxin-antitoxin system death-on-curing family toxin [Candidatus Microgenomates bacterium]
MKIITPKQILIVHEHEIKKHGGSSGIRDVGMLESAIGRPFATFAGKDLYITIFLKAGALVQSLVKNHPFVDGNKRTALVSAIVFLKMNNYILSISQDKSVDFVMDVANKNLSVDQISLWFKKHSKKITQ